MKAFLKEQILIPVLLALLGVPTILSKLSDKPNILCHQLEITMMLWEPTLLFILLGYLWYMRYSIAKKVSSELIKNKEMFDLNMYNSRKEKVLNWKNKIDELEIYTKEQNDNEVDIRYSILRNEFLPFLAEKERNSLPDHYGDAIPICINRGRDKYYGLTYLTALQKCLTLIEKSWNLI